MCGCLGLTSDIRVKAWKGKSIYRQTSEGEASPAQVGPREPGLQLHNLLICQIWMEQTARTAQLKQVHCWLRYTHRFTSESANSSAASPEVWVDWGGVSTGSHKGLYVGTSKPRESADQQPVNRFMVLAIFPCAPYRHGYDWVHSERHETDDRKRELTMATAVGPEWLQLDVAVGYVAQIKQILFTCLWVYWNFSLTKVKI